MRIYNLPGIVLSVYIHYPIYFSRQFWGECIIIPIVLVRNLSTEKLHNLLKDIAWVNDKAGIQIQVCHALKFVYSTGGHSFLPSSLYH